MNHYYTSHEEYLYLLAFFEANPALPTPPHYPTYHPTRFTPQTTDLDIPTAPESSKPNVGSGSRSRVRKGRKVVPSRRPRSRRAALGFGYSNFDDRLRVLEEDPLVLEIWQEENMVQCGGCEKRIQLDNRKRRSLHLQNWTTHKSRCKMKAKEQQLTELPSSSGRGATHEGVGHCDKGPCA